MSSILVLALQEGERSCRRSSQQRPDKHPARYVAAIRFERCFHQLGRVPAPAADSNTVAGVVTTADTMQQRIRQGPAQVQSVLLNLQKRLDEQRLMGALKVCNINHTSHFPYKPQ